MIEWPGPASNFSDREILGEKAYLFLRKEVESLFPVRGFGDRGQGLSRWKLHLGQDLIFDRNGLKLVLESLRRYEGHGRVVEFVLRLDLQTLKDYYSLKSTTSNEFKLPIRAVLGNNFTGKTETLVLSLPVMTHSIPFPMALTSPVMASMPTALLMSYETDFDLLFANQILLGIQLIQRISRRPPFLRVMAGYLRSMRRFRNRPWKKNLALTYREIHPSAFVHPTAVIEGSVVGPGCQIGAHCTVRWSYLVENVRLHDGAKVEFSIVGRNSWLMHDLVLYRSYTEDEVFLIHGPYQFSAFHSGSAAFATIMMDYRADGKPIKVNTPDGTKYYLGIFLGSVLRSGAKTFGGSLVAPGQIVPSQTWLGCASKSVHFVDPQKTLPIEKALSP